MMLKGLNELKSGFDAFIALEMLIIRLCYVKSLPTPEQLLEKLNSDNNSGNNNNFSNSNTANSNNAPIKTNAANESLKSNTSKERNIAFSPLNSFEEIVEFVKAEDELMLYHHLVFDTSFISLKENHLSIKPLDNAPKNLPMQLQELLKNKTQQNWMVTSSSQDGAKTLGTKFKEEQELANKKIIESSPVQEMLKTFTGLEIADIKASKVN
jgi:DNA polymerase-3 subunit gamma/tau